MTHRMLVTTALPYANGPIHLGHLLEHIQTDIWVRFQRLIGRECIYVCADDAHGTATMLSAEANGLTIDEWLKQIGSQHEKDLRSFGMSYDNYYTTHSSENKEYSEYIYKHLVEKDYISRRKVKQLFDQEKQMFLADRFIKGECPKCGMADQYGDNCESCGSTYDAIELKKPYSLLSKSKPIVKESEHLFFRLPLFEQKLKKWIATRIPQPEVSNKLNEWFQKGLQEWNISRDPPYFGFTIPGYEKKYFYVWLDAPVGYIASFANLCSQRGWKFEDIWQDPNTSIYHFIGKDIIYFHCLFWPALLESADLAQPDGVFVHGFVTVNNMKMSKSRGTFILAEKYARLMDIEHLRYYFASKLSDKVEDIDLNLMEFKTRINSDLVGKFVNIASRCAHFINRNFDNRLASQLSEKELMLFRQIAAVGDEIAELYDKRRFSKAMRLIMLYADNINQYIEEMKPWELSVSNAQDPRVQQICTAGLNYFRLLVIYLQPVLPELTEKACQLFRISELKWHDRQQPLLESSIASFSPLLVRIRDEQIEKLVSND